MIKQDSEKTGACKICGAITRVIDDKQIRVTYSVCDECGFIYKNEKHHLNHNLE